MLLALLILIGYSGIGVFTMVCSKSGYHVSKSLYQKKTCKHQSKSCCAAQQEKPCCDFLFQFYQLKDATVLNKIMHTVNQPSVIGIGKPLTQNIIHIIPSEPIGCINSHAPPNLPIKSNLALAKIGVFRI